MLQTIKNMLGLGTAVNYAEMVQTGGIILDVRSKAEFASGHIENSINIPVDQLHQNLAKLKDKKKCIICCCASGMRSGSAKRILESKGYTSVFNGGSWLSLRNKI